MRRWVRWRGGEVERSDRHFRSPGSLKGLREFPGRHPRPVLLAAARTDPGNAEPRGDGSHMSFTPTGLYCYPVREAAIRAVGARGTRANRFFRSLRLSK